MRAAVISHVGSKRRSPDQSRQVSLEGYTPGLLVRTVVAHRDLTAVSRGPRRALAQGPPGAGFWVVDQEWESGARAMRKVSYHSNFLTILTLSHPAGEGSFHIGENDGGGVNGDGISAENFRSRTYPPRAGMHRSICSRTMGVASRISISMDLNTSRKNIAPGPIPPRQARKRDSD
jgi:hypothetical protein